MIEQHFNVVPNELLNELIRFCDTEAVWEDCAVTGVEYAKYAPQELHYLPFDTILSNIFGGDWKFVGGNFYEHNVPYLPHTDYRISAGQVINVVIPLRVIGDASSLVVFDQEYLHDSVTWSMGGKVHKFALNTGVPDGPCSYDVTKLTGKEIDDDLYSYIDHYPREYLFGLSGSVFPQTPGSMIILPGWNIHCTSKFTGVKLGLTLRYQVSTLPKK